LLLDNVQSSGPFVSASAYVDTDLVYSRYIRYIRGTFYGGVGLVFSSMRSTPSYAFLPGLKMGVHFGRDTGTFFRQDVSVFHSLFFPISFFQGKTEFQVDLGENINGSLIFKFRDVQSLVFPRDFAPSTDLDSNQSAFGFSKNFVKDKSRTQLDWRLGYEWLGYTPPQGVGESVFTSLGYKLISDDLNVNFSFGYYFQRVY